MSVFLVVQVLYHSLYGRWVPYEPSLSVSLSHKHTPKHTVCKYRFML